MSHSSESEADMPVADRESLAYYVPYMLMVGHGPVS